MDLKEGSLGAKLFTELKKDYKPNGEETFSLTLTKKALTENMQKDDACFEACAVILKSLGWNVCLKLDKKAEKYLSGFEKEIDDLNTNIGNEHIREKIFSSEKRHCLRFLYRLYRFKEQYSWLEIDEELSSLFEKFLKALEEKRIRLINNAPTRNAKTNPEYPESMVEALMADHKNNVFWVALNGKPNDQEIGRQLPVGLYLGDHTKGKEFFPTGRIDLWTGNKEKIQVVELKIKNPMIGIITEIFFYSNFMYDLTREIFKFNESNTELRGYRHLKDISKNVHEITGVMLADRYHPLLEDEESQKAILRVMNGSDKIQYSMASYKFKEEKNGITIRKGNFSAFLERA